MFICLMLYLLIFFDLYDFKKFNICFGEIMWILVLVFFIFWNICFGELSIFILRFLRIFVRKFDMCEVYFIEICLK